MEESVLWFLRSVGQDISHPLAPTPIFFGGRKRGEKFFENFSRFPIRNWQETCNRSASNSVSFLIASRYFEILRTQFRKILLYIINYISSFSPPCPIGDLHPSDKAGYIFINGPGLTMTATPSPPEQHRLSSATVSLEFVSCPNATSNKLERNGANESRSVYQYQTALQKQHCLGIYSINVTNPS